MKSIFSGTLAAVLCILGVAVIASLAAAACAAPQKAGAVHSPARGVVCDQYFCADKLGISNGLTAHYLGKAAAARLIAQGQFVRTEFTFSNGIFCDTIERRCRQDRFYQVYGKRSPISLKYTALLFGGTNLMKK
ncbi:hypothetical protein Brsp05_04485 [Brucella sp. NBRC 12953]|uniref:YcgJ family protein n=1 Tax=Brucella sp. NBRC 12953 TaxID=3075481 RepID=UPI00309917E7